MLALTFLAILSAQPVTLQVEIVSSPTELRRGLQGHAPLGEGQGMLFVFPQPEMARFWMKDMTFPIDILFVEKNGRVAGLSQSVPPCATPECKIFASDKLVDYVLETSAGWSQKHGVLPGTLLAIDVSKKRVTVNAK